MRYALLDPHQNISDKPRNFVKKSVGLLLLRRLEAELLENGVLRLFPKDRKPATLTERYVEPGKFPPREIPGVYFKPPTTSGKMLIPLDLAEVHDLQR